MSLPGRIDAEGRRRLLEQCRFVCSPSREETFGIGVTEACAAGRPVIYFDLPPMNQVTPAEEVAARGRACRVRVQEYR